MTCNKTCNDPKPAQAHCGVCHVTFSGVTLFDEHRSIPVIEEGKKKLRKSGKCRAPQVMGLVEHNGVWGNQAYHDKSIAASERLKKAA